MRKLIFCLTALSLFVSCSSYKHIVYLQGAEHVPTVSEISPSSFAESKLKVGDLLIITVNTTATPEVAVPYNLPLVPLSGNTGSVAVPNPSATTSVALQNYLIDKEGYIVYPGLGKIKAAGMTKSQLTEYIKNRIYPQFITEEPIVNIRYVNYKISVLGEVARPSVYSVENEKIDIFQAIAMAGDLTIYGQRNNVLLVRENENGKHLVVNLDLTDKNLIDSPYYYLQQNDVLYVQPNKPRARSAHFGTAETLSISIVGTLISLASLIVVIAR